MQTETMLSQTLAAYTDKRLTSGPLPAGSAPYTSSHAYKIATPELRAVAQRWDHHFSHESSHRASSTLKASSRVSNPSAVISLGTARPAPVYYPWQSITIQATDAHHIHNDHNDSSKSTSCSKGEAAYDLGLALNYGYAAGSPQVLRFITEHIEMIHNPVYSDWECSLTCGTTSAIEIILRMLCDRDYSVLCEKFTYPGTIEAANALGLKMIGIAVDGFGMIPADLQAALEDWDTAKGRKPSVLYIIPSGQNPTGATQTVERRKAIYELAEQHDLIILEDDPYHFIQFRGPETNGHASATALTQREKYVRSLPPSYLSLDTSGRVLRLDATSKILAPGLRCGWVTGCSQLVQKFIEHTELSTVAPSGPSQLLLYKLLDEAWGHEGFLNWLIHLSSEYQKRLQTLTAACRRHLPADICKWRTPSAGMFIWIEIDCSHHPTARHGISCQQRRIVALQVEDKVYTAAREQGVLVSKGSWFTVDKETYSRVFFRMTFAAVSDNELETAVARFGIAICAEFKINGPLN